MWNKKKKKDTYWIKTKNPITNPWADAVTISAFNASAVMSTVMGPNPKNIPDSSVLSVIIAQGSRVERKSTRQNTSHIRLTRMPSSA